MTTHFADLVKYTATQYFDWDGNKDEAGRTLLQHVGTDLFRHYDENFWVRYIAVVLVGVYRKWDYVLIPDTRFDNEVTFLRDCNFNVEHLDMYRPELESALTAEQQAHESECGLSIIPDYCIMNDKGLDELRDSAETFAYSLTGKTCGDINEFSEAEDYVNAGN
jgi:hypothetical protein